MNTGYTSRLPELDSFFTILLVSNPSSKYSTTFVVILSKKAVKHLIGHDWKHKCTPKFITKAMGK